MFKSIEKRDNIAFFSFISPFYLLLEYPHHPLFLVLKALFHHFEHSHSFPEVAGKIANNLQQNFKELNSELLTTTGHDSLHLTPIYLIIY
jgi:hypothetical protein